MTPDKYQQAWQAHTSQTRVTVDADLLLKEVQRNQHVFLETIFRRDSIEIGVMLLLLPVWLYLGRTTSSPWTWYLEVPALIGVSGFLLAYRKRHPQKPSEPDEPLLECAKDSLTQVESQIWLLRNVHWWYLLPLGLPILAFFAHISWRSAIATNDWLAALGVASLLCSVLLGVYIVIYYLNQRVVRSQLEPRRHELLALLAGLGDEATIEQVVLRSDKSPKCSRKYGGWGLVAASCLVTFLVIGLADGAFDSRYGGPPQSSGPAGDSLAKQVTDLRRKMNLVGLAAMVMVDGQVEAVAAQGERKKGSGVPLEIGDRWHLGGITKSITATMMARLIESGQMNWTDTVGEAFPEGVVHEDWKPVTLRQLLTDTAGRAANFPKEVSRQRLPLGPECTKARREAVLDVIAEKPAFPPGEERVYSNVGYTIAGAMAEQTTGVTWENLMKQEVFTPLKLWEAGFGPPKSPSGTLEQPRGHRLISYPILDLPFFIRKWAVTDEADNTPIMGPAGTVHMTLENLCTFANEHLRGEHGKGQILSDDTYKILHTPALRNYACGWLEKHPTYDIPHTLYWHNGSNTLWYALVVFIPAKNMVIAVTSNDGDYRRAETAAWEIVSASANQFNVEGDAELRKFLLPDTFPKKSPFAAVRWQESQPEVKVGEEWFELVSLDELPAAEIIAFSQRTYGDKWQKRFEEDLVELLTRMGHPPQDTVTLVVQSLDSSETRTLNDVSMTEANRWAIRAAAAAREHNE